MNTQVVWATEKDTLAIFDFIKQLAQFEKLEHEMVTDVDTLHENLFGPHKYAEVVFLEEQGVRVGFALFFHNFSTFLGKPGLYLEDLFVNPQYRGKGYGKRLLAFLAKTALERKCGRFEWRVLDWNQSAIDLYLSMGSVAMSDWTEHRVSGAALEKLAASYKS